MLHKAPLSIFIDLHCSCLTRLLRSHKDPELAMSLHMTIGSKAEKRSSPGTLMMKKKDESPGAEDKVEGFDSERKQVDFGNELGKWSQAILLGQIKDVRHQNPPSITPYKLFPLSKFSKRKAEKTYFRLGCWWTGHSIG
ncbi:hypothetical protein MUK42_35254 [Musa troglodytarum]|uniref:Uncharacterized protein n=1 Tax=Musa troglodytarum TaxID=320322 RepID=A0A9E7K9Z5_9LILI|nr:hypothetical protein MUK42_35254 [Musa troglodytarum]